MATTKTKAKPSPAKSTGKKNGTATVTSGNDDLLALAMANAGLESEIRSQGDSKLSFISLLTKQSKALDEDHPNYMEKAKLLDYAVVSKKLLLGKELDATILGMFKVYAEVTKKESKSDIPRTVSFWMPEQAQQFEIMQGSYFDRELPNGNMLQPQHWVFLYLHDFPELEDGLISFRSVGNIFYKQIEKMVQENSSACTELRVKVSNQKKKNETYDKTDYYPAIEIVGTNYSIKNGKLVKGDADVDADTLKEILSRSKKLHEDYAQMRLVSKKNLQALMLSPDRKAIPAYIDESSGDIAF